MGPTMKERFNSFFAADAFQRVDADHLLDLYIGLDELSRPALMLMCPAKPRKLASARYIDIRIGQRSDGLWALSFALTDKTLEDVFFQFCTDIIESSRVIHTKSNGSTFVCDRYEKWLDMFAKSISPLLGPSEIKGLIGELLFLRDHLFQIYGQEIALSSWIGPEKADQDFICPDKWFEVKTTTSGSEGIHISSIEQLDTTSFGELIIVYLDRTSHADPMGIIINVLVKGIYEILESEDLRQQLSSILFNFGYFERSEYEGHPFKYSGTDRYGVTETFPSLRRHSLPASLINAKYELSISCLQNFLLR